MNTQRLKSLVASVQQPSFWDFTNDVLYQLCRKHPKHSDPSVAAAKVLLIGRSYAAAIERRKKRFESTDDFYITRVAPKVIHSMIDDKIATLKSIRSLSIGSLQLVVESHKYVTDLFNRISGLDKRSLASKYLHFHTPQLVFIYDSRAVKGLRELSGITGRASQSDSGSGDKQYRIFAKKCLTLRDHISERYDVMLSPRQIDRLLLEIS